MAVVVSHLLMVLQWQRILIGANLERKLILLFISVISFSMLIGLIITNTILIKDVGGRVDHRVKEVVQIIEVAKTIAAVALQVAIKIGTVTCLLHLSSTKSNTTCSLQAPKIAQDTTLSIRNA